MSVYHLSFNCAWGSIIVTAAGKTLWLTWAVVYSVAWLSGYSDFIMMIKNNDDNSDNKQNIS